MIQTQEVYIMHRKFLYLIFSAALLGGITACSPGNTGIHTKPTQETEESSRQTVVVDEEDGFVTGTWDGLTFSNPWLGLSLTLPEDSYVYTEQDMAVVLGEGENILINNGNYTDEQLQEAPDHQHLRSYGCLPRQSGQHSAGL